MNVQDVERLAAMQYASEENLERGTAARLAMARAANEHIAALDDLLKKQQATKAAFTEAIEFTDERLQNCTTIRDLLDKGGTTGIESAVRLHEVMTEDIAKIPEHRRKFSNIAAKIDKEIEATKEAMKFYRQVSDASGGVMPPDVWNVCDV